jgi:hypothetical protein
VQSLDYRGNRIHDVVEEPGLEVSLFSNVCMFEAAKMWPLLAKRLQIYGCTNILTSSEGVMKSLGVVESGDVVGEICPSARRAKKRCLRLLEVAVSMRGFPINSSGKPLSMVSRGLRKRVPAPLILMVARIEVVDSRRVEVSRSCMSESLLSIWGLFISWR